MESNKAYEFSAGTLTRISDDVILAKYTVDRKLTEQDIIDIRDLRKKLIGDTPYFFVLDMTDGIVTFSREAKKWVAENQESANVRILDIFIVRSWVMKVEVQLYLKIFKPINTTIVVSSLDKAMESIEVYKMQAKRA